MSVYRESLNEYLQNLEVHADNVCDVGGASNPVKDLVKVWDVKNYGILDNSIEDPIAEFDEFDLNTTFVSKGYQGFFDTVFCLDVMEYVYNPVHAMRQLADMLTDDGILYITFNTLYPVHNPADYDYLRYTRQGVDKLLDISGLKVIESKVRMIRHQEMYKDYVKAEGYKVRGALKKGVLYDAGYIIKAVRK